jgi:hypothetical protein
MFHYGRPHSARVGPRPSRPAGALDRATRVVAAIAPRSRVETLGNYSLAIRDLRRRRRPGTIEGSAIRARLEGLSWTRLFTSMGCDLGF